VTQSHCCDSPSPLQPSNLTNENARIIAGVFASGAVATILANINLDQKFRVSSAWEGTYYFAVSAYNSPGIDGAFSNVPSKTL
jgi:hypothetical protein